MPNQENKWVTIGGLSRQTGCNIETIRYYERINILPEAPRTAGGRRLFSPEHVKRLKFVRRSRALGFRLDEVRELLNLVDSNNYSCQEVESLTAIHIRDVKDKIRDLRKIERILETMASQCAGGIVPECPIIEGLYGDNEVP